MTDQIIVALISALGGIVVSLVGFFVVYGRNRAETAKLRAETDKLLGETKQLQDNQKRLEEETEEIRQVISYTSYHDAFPKMVKLIEDHLSRCKEQNEEQIVTLKLISVAMTFSWDNFVRVDLARLISHYSEAVFNIDVLFIDHEFLADQPIAQFGIGWVKQARDRIEDVNAFADECRRFYPKRVHFRARKYRNLPHWHGWLINENNLYLGRADWDYQNGEPVLRVGQNKYRHFDTSNNEGKERIDLFKSWQKFYFEFTSELVCDSTDHNASVALK